MIKYTEGNLIINSDFQIRKIRHIDTDIDLIVPLELRTLNLYIEDLPNYIEDRIQFTEVRNLIIRFTTNKDDYCTIHFLKSIDLQSAMVNFVMNYKSHYIEIVKREYSVELYLKKK